MKFGIYWIFMCLFIISSCSNEPESCEASTQNLSGSIDGSNWSAGEGSAKAIVEDGVDKLKITVYENGAAITELCTSVIVERTVTTTIPLEIDNYQLSFDLQDVENNQTVSINGSAGSSDLLVTVGCLEVLSISATEVELKMLLQSAGADMEGTVSVTRCN